MPMQILPMSARDRAQHHRVSTPLELFFDLGSGPVNLLAFPRAA